MTAEQKTQLVNAAKAVVSTQIEKRESAKSVYFESTLPNGTVFEIEKTSLPIAHEYAGHEYYTIKTKDNKDIVLSKLAQADFEKVFDLIGKQAFKLRADLINEVPALSKRDGRKYLKRIFEYSLVE